MLNTTILHYKILEKLGEGGMGVVYKAEDTKLKRTVALKFLPHYITANAEERKRFEIEAQAAASLNHPNIATIYAIEESDDNVFIVMEYIDGKELKSLVETHLDASLRIDDIINYAIQIAEGLMAAHNKGIIHRDIKSRNIMVTNDGKIKIMDFGLAKIREGAQVTKIGSTVGTAAYMSPEQARGEDVDQRTDIWSFGVVLYEMLTGEMPFKGDYDQAIIYSILNEEPENVSNISPELISIIKKSLSKNPYDRYSNTGEIISDLKELNEDGTLIKTTVKDFRRLSAIMFTDIAGYSALTQRNEELALELLKEHRKILRSVFTKYSGKEIETAGDSFFVEFESALNAAKCAVEIQKTLYDRNLHVAKEERILLRIGLHVGDVVHTGKHVHGDGVNLAARLEPLASPGCICVSEDVARQIQNKVDYPVLKVGKRKLKNIRLPMNVYKILLPWEKEQSKFFVLSQRDYFSPKASLKFVLPILLFLFIGYFIWQISKDDIPVGSPEMKRLAILPFNNIRSDPETNFLGFALADQIIGSLAYIENILVRPSSAVRKYEFKGFNPSDVGKDLNVDFILTGNYLKESDIVRLNLELVEIKSNEIIWRNDFDVAFENTFTLQDIVAEKVVSGLKVKFTYDEKYLDTPEDPLAYEYYLKAVSYPLNNHANHAAIAILKKAIDLDSAYAPLYSELGYRYQLLSTYDPKARNMIVLAEESYLKALSINKNLLIALGNLASHYTELGKTIEAVKLIKRALEINKNNPEAHFWMGYIFRYAGLLEESAKEMETAVKLDPNNPRFRSIGTTYFYLNRYEEAIRGFELDKGSPLSLSWTGVVYFWMNKLDSAKNYLNKAVRADSNSTTGLWSKTFLEYIGGNKKGGIKLVRILEMSDTYDGEQFFNYAMLYTLYGQNEDCLRTLKKAIENGFFCYPLFLNDSFFEPMKAVPEFKELYELTKKKSAEFREKISEL